MTRMESAIAKTKIDLNIDKKIIFLILTSFFLGRVSILDRLYPFGIAFLGSYIIMRKANKGILLATMIGTFSAQGFSGFSYYLSTMLIYGFFTIYKDNKKYSLVISSIIIASIFTITRLIGLNITQNLFMYDLILVLFESILVFTMTYVFSFSIPIEGFGTKEISNEKMICSFITLALVLAGFTNLSIYGASLKNIVSIIMILALSYNQGIYMGATTGIILGMIAYISNVEMPFIIAILGIGGMLSGLFKELGKSGSILGFILGNGIISFYINGLGTSFLGYQEIIISSLVFLVFYKKIEKSIDNLFKPVSKVKKDYENRRFELASNKLSSMSELLDSMAKTFKETIQERDVYSSSEIYSIIDDVNINKCKGCESYSKCWEERYYTTYYSLFTTIGLMETNVEERDKKIIDVLENCNDIEGLVCVLNDIYSKYKEREIIAKKVKENRMVLIEQIEGLGKVIGDINIDIYKNSTFNEELEVLLEKEIKNKRFDIRELVVAQLAGDNIEIYMEFGSNNTLEKIEKIIKVVTNALGYPVSADYTLGSIENTNKFKLIRTNRYGSLTKVSEFANSENGVTGDNYTFGEVENTAFSAISDGMGTGNKASIESTTAIEILEKMMEINIEKDMAIKTINNVLRTRSDNEMFTTLDLSFVDLYRGRLQVIKSGASPTFIKRRDEVKIINSMSLPIGLLKDVDFNIYEEDIEDGDLIIMMSDGVLECNRSMDNPENWMTNVITGLKSQSPQAIADEILGIAKLTRHNEINDDMTVLVTKIWKNN